LHAAVAVATLGASAAMSIAQAADYRMLSSWDQNYPMRKLLVEPFIKSVNAASKGSVNIRLSGPETVPPFEQLQPTGSGVFHFLFTHGAYHFGTSPIATAVEALSGGLEDWRKAGVKQELDKHYNQFGVTLIGLAVSTPGSGYNILLRQPAKPTGDLAGYKVRGTPTYGGVFKMLGASPVVLPPGEIYTSLEKGLVDGAAWPTFGMTNYRWHEVAKYLLRPAFGTTTQLIFAHKATWDRMKPDDRKVVMEEIAKLEDAYTKAFDKVMQDEEADLKSKGVTVVQMGDAQKAKLAQAWSDGLWELTAQKNAKDTTALRKFAVSKGLSK
jgi:TRAP-type C4-dicarboxylate transport system substrate-binding protein